MKKRVVTGMATVVEFEHPAVFLMVLSCCAATRGMAYPSSGDVKWAESFLKLGGPEVDRDFWYPYQLTKLGMCLKPEYSAVYRYVSRHAFTPPRVILLDPADWRNNVDNLLADCVFTDEEMRGTVEQALAEYFDPAGPDLEYRDLMDLRVRQALSANTMILDPRKARAAIRNSNAQDEGED